MMKKIFALGLSFSLISAPLLADNGISANTNAIASASAEEPTPLDKAEDVPANSTGMNPCPEGKSCAGLATLTFFVGFTVAALIVRTAK